MNLNMHICIFVVKQPFTMLSIHCDCPATVHLIYTMGNGSVQLKNGFIQHTFQMNLIFLSKNHNNSYGIDAFFFLLTKSLHYVLLKNIQEKPNKSESDL